MKKHIFLEVSKKVAFCAQMSSKWSPLWVQGPPKRSQRASQRRLEKHTRKKTQKESKINPPTSGPVEFFAPPPPDLLPISINSLREAILIQRPSLKALPVIRRVFFLDYFWSSCLVICRSFLVFSGVRFRTRLGDAFWSLLEIFWVPFGSLWGHLWETFGELSQLYGSF